MLRKNEAEQRGILPAIKPAAQDYGDSWTDKPHEELVAGFRGYLRQYRQRFSFVERHSDTKIFKETLMIENNIQKPPERGALFQPIYHAFHVISYNHEGLEGKADTAWIISRRYKDEVDLMQRLANLPSERWRFSYRKPLSSSPELIELNPFQVKILDALAEATGIPHPKGQAVIEIPQQLRDFEKWKQSVGYEAQRAPRGTDRPKNYAFPFFVTPIV